MLGRARLSGILEADAPTSTVVLGAIEFIESLPDDLSTGAVVRMEDNGEIWAVVSGYQVRLGREVEMRAKALSLAALLDVDPPKDAVLTLIAPTHPAVTPPKSSESEEIEAEPTDQTEGP